MKFDIKIYRHQNMTLYILFVLCFCFQLLLYEIRYKNASTYKYHSKALGVSSTADPQGAYWAPGPRHRTAPTCFLDPYGALWSPMNKKEISYGAPWSPMCFFSFVLLLFFCWSKSCSTKFDIKIYRHTNMSPYITVVCIFVHVHVHVPVRTP